MTDDVALYRRADEAFHSTLAKASGNERLTRLIDGADVLVPLADDGTG